MINSIDVSEETNKPSIQNIEATKIKAVSSDNFEETVKTRNQIDANSEQHINDMKERFDEIKKDKIDDLMGKLNEVSDIQNQNSILHDCETHIADGKAFFNALNGDQEKINKKINELSNRGTRSGFKSHFFLKLDELNDEDLQKEYIKYFESQTSQYYLGGVINDLLSSSFNKGFFSAMNGKDGKIDEEFSKIICITQKLINIAKKINAKHIS